MSRASITSVGVLAAMLQVSLPATAAPHDAEASSVAKQAMDDDYLGTQFKDAEEKLQKALKSCGKSGCSPSVQSQLHLDLAIVYLAGLKKNDKGNREMQAAIAADPAVQLNPDFSTPDIEKAYAAAGGVKQASDASEPATTEHTEEQAEPASTTSEAAPTEGAKAASTPRNWLSLSFQQDLLSYKQTSGVCTGAAQYQCFLQGQSYVDAPYAGSGNQLQGGIGFATRRVLVGYDRLLGDNVTLGARVGFAFAGSPKATVGNGTAFLPFHAEARGSYWFGEKPFESTGLRGYAGIAAGLGEVDGHVTVEYYVDQAGYDSGAKGKLDAWRKTGNSFVGVHAGLAYAIIPEQELLLELRVLQLLGSTALGGAVNLGYAFGL